MYLRIALIAAAAVGLVACAHNPKTGIDVAGRFEITGAVAPRKAVATAQGASSTELRVRMNQDLGRDVSPSNDLFSARLTTPLLDGEGRVLAPVGSLVHGHVVHAHQREPRIEIAFDRLETREGIYMISATVISARPYALTIRPSDEVAGTESTVVLEGSNAPSAIGGGPPVPESEGDQLTPRGEALLPFDAELQLKLLKPPMRAME